MPIDIRAEFEAGLARQSGDFTVRGVVTGSGEVFPLGTDTKVLSTIFEAFARPIVYEIAERHGLEVWEAQAQNSYPDFTLMRAKDDRSKISIDVKTTYCSRPGDKVNFTLGSYTSFIRDGTKGIEFPYADYAEDWIVGYVYQRLDPDEVPAHVYELDEVHAIPPPYGDVEVFVRQKWEIAGDKAGSGNTANIGSVRSTVADFRTRKPLFATKSEFLDYWRGYGKTAAERSRAYKSLDEFRSAKAS